MLSAGLATRLRPLSFVRAKAAVPVAGQPLACRILRQLSAAGITDAVLNLHHLPATLTGTIGDGADLGVRVRYSWESPVVLGSAGGPRRALPLLGASTFLIVNGDTLTDADISAVVREHQGSGALVTMALIENTEPEKYGGVVLDAGGNVTGFVRRGSSTASYHFIGVQVAEAEAFASLPDNVPAESVASLYPALIAARPGAIRGIVCRASFMDIGTPADYLATSLALAEGRHELLIGARAAIAEAAIIDRSILWDDVSVGRGASLKECVVTDGAAVPADTSWHGVTIRRPDGQLADGERIIEGLAVRGL